MQFLLLTSEPFVFRQRFFVFFVHGYIPILVTFLGLLVSSFLTLGSMSVYR